MKTKPSIAFAQLRPWMTSRARRGHGDVSMEMRRGRFSVLAIN